MLGPLYRENDGVSGEIFRFVKLDPNEPWFNAATQEAASPEELRNVSIPEHLLPHLQKIPFVFYANSHRLYFVSRDRTTRLGPAAVKTFLEAALGNPGIESLFPDVHVTVVPDSETLEKIFSMHTLERLTIELTRPNPDDGDDDEARWMDRLQRQNSRKLKVELTAGRHESLAPDNETRSLAVVAASNGKVFAEGRDVFGIKQRESTIEKPLLESAQVDSELQTVFDVLRETAAELDQRFG
jgi:hypothetical protein